MSIKKLFSLLSFTILTFYGCQNIPAKIMADQNIWNRLTIGFKNSEIIISNLDTTAILRKVLNYKKSTKDNSTTYTPNKIEETTVKITSKEKDSIYKWTKKLISEPFKPKTFCTDYVGKLFLDIEVDEQVTYSCKYTSICEWSTMNNETLKLHKLLINKFKLE